MLRNLASVIGFALILGLSTAASAWAAEFGTAEEAKAALDAIHGPDDVISEISVSKAL